MNSEAFRPSQKYSTSRESHDGFFSAGQLTPTPFQRNKNADRQAEQAKRPESTKGKNATPITPPPLPAHSEIYIG